MNTQTTKKQANLGDQPQTFESLILSLTLHAQAKMKQATKPEESNIAGALAKALIMASPKDQEQIGIMMDAANSGEAIISEMMPDEKFKYAIVAFHKLYCNKCTPEDMASLTFITKALIQVSGSEDIAQTIHNNFKVRVSKMQQAEVKEMKANKPKVFPEFLTKVLADEKQGYFYVNTKGDKVVNLFVSDPNKLPAHLKDRIPFRINNKFASEQDAVNAAKYCSYFTVGGKKDLKKSKEYYVERKRPLQL
jgi:hypothetical protein